MKIKDRKIGSYAKRVGRCGLMREKSNFPVSKKAMVLKCSNLYPRALRFAA